MIDVETGLYFGKKNSFIENQNIFISGITQKEEQNVIGKLIKFNEKNKNSSNICLWKK